MIVRMDSTTIRKHSFPSCSPADALSACWSWMSSPESGIGLKGNMPTLIVDIVGKRFGNLTVVSFSGIQDNGLAAWNCICDCGNKFTTAGANLRRKIRPSTSCGCLKSERIRAKLTKHGMDNTPTYRTWHGMKNRCLNPKATGYENYGGRGISICEKWMTFEGFLDDMGIRPEGTTLERKNNDLGYCKDNCKWATRIEQGANMRTNINFTINGETKCVSEWARIHGINKDTLGSRIKSGWDLDDLFTPSRPMKPRKTINQ